MVQVNQWVSDLGLPIALLLFLGYSVWKAARHIAPIITRVAEKHYELIDTLKIQSSQQTAIMESQNKVLSQHGRLLERIDQAVHDDDHG